MNFRAMLEIIKDTLKETLSSKVFYVLLVFSTLLGILVAMFNFEPSGKDVFGNEQCTASFAIWEMGKVPVNVENIQTGILSFLANTLCGLFGVITAIIITGSFVPRMFQTGTIELYTSRPISRWQILLAKYIGGLSFVFFQASWLVCLVFLAFGIRSGVWTFNFLWAIPILTFLFAVLYAFSVLMAVVWKKTVPAILLTIAFWILCGLVGKARMGIVNFLVMSEPQVARFERMKENPKLLKTVQADYDDFMWWQGTMKTANTWLLRVNYVIPATTELDLVAVALYTGKETVEMARQHVVEVEENEQSKKDENQSKPSPGQIGKIEKVDVKIAMKRPIYTCLGFIICCLGLASVLFYRKEF